MNMQSNTYFMYLMPVVSRRHFLAWQLARTMRFDQAVALLAEVAGSGVTL
jgi:hypothetical protein